MFRAHYLLIGIMLGAAGDAVAQGPLFAPSVVDTTDRERISEDTTSRSHRYIGRWKEFTSGNLELGGYQGAPAFSTASSPRTGLVAKGAISARVLRIPLRVELDLGTDIAARGQRDRFRVSFDRSAVLKNMERTDQVRLDSVHGVIDSLQNVRAELFRQWKSVDDRARYERVRQTTRPQGGLPIDTVLPTAPTLDPGMPDTTLSPPRLPDDGSDIDRLVHVASSRKAALDAAEARLEKARQHEARLQALLQASRDRTVLSDMLQGLRSLDIGNCTPAHSVFLINGLNLNGVSTEFMSKDLYVAFDHGKSFDDTWRTRTLSDQQLRRLQETFFFQDPEDLNPRRLTSIQVGFGEHTATHFHVGMLRGTRDAVPLGVVVPEQRVLKETNHVIELDAGFEVKKGHALRVVLGRSLLGNDGDTEGPGTTLGGLMDRRREHNQALQAEWSSRFERSGTDLSLSGRAIDANFHSLGLAFLRSGSRNAELGAAQRVGKRLRLRGTYRIEERTSAAPSLVTTDLLRWRLQATYKPYQWLTLRGAFAPMHITSHLPEGPAVQHNRITQGGWDARKRYGRNTATAHFDMSHYAWQAMGADAISIAWSFNGGISYTTQRTTVDLAANTLVQEDSTSAPVTAATAAFTWSLQRTLSCTARVSGQLNDRIDPSWSVMVRRSIGKHCYAVLSTTRIVRPQIISSESFENSVVDNYSCQASFGFNW